MRTVHYILVCDNRPGMYDNGVWNTIQSGNNWQTLITGDHWRDFWIESDPIAHSTRLLLTLLHMKVHYTDVSNVMYSNSICSKT